MENSLINTANTALTMSSREISEYTNKKHQHVKRDIEKMFAELGLDASKLGHIYKDSMNRDQIEYFLDKEQTYCLLAGYSAVLRMEVIKRWKELEERNQFKIPQTLPEALQLAAELAKQTEEQKLQLNEQAPKVESFETFINTDSTFSFSEAAKMHRFGVVRMNKLLAANNIIFRHKPNAPWMPYQQYIDSGYFEVKAVENKDQGKTYSQARFTPKGIDWLAKRFTHLYLKEYGDLEKAK